MSTAPFPCPVAGCPAALESKAARAAHLRSDHAGLADGRAKAPGAVFVAARPKGWRTAAERVSEPASAGNRASERDKLRASAYAISKDQKPLAQAASEFRLPSLSKPIATASTRKPLPWVKTPDDPATLRALADLYDQALTVPTIAKHDGFRRHFASQAAYHRALADDREALASAPASSARVVGRGTVNAVRGK